MKAMTGFVATVGARPRRALCIPGMNAGVFRAKLDKYVLLWDKLTVAAA